MIKRTYVGQSMYKTTEAKCVRSIRIEFKRKEKLINTKCKHYNYSIIKISVFDFEYTKPLAL